MSEVNDGVSIILGRMESNPEEFFETHREDNKWRWIFGENIREAMTEPEKAAIYEGMKKVRRLEITAKAVATVLPKEEEETFEHRYVKQDYPKGAMWNGIVPQGERKRIK